MVSFISSHAQLQTTRSKQVWRLFKRRGAQIEIVAYYQFNATAMGLKMLDALSIAPIMAVGFAYWLSKRLDDKGPSAQTITKTLANTTGDKELDVILGLAAPVPIVRTTSSS